jgi:hypothetical protein
MLFIAAESSAQQRDFVGGGGGGLAMCRTSKKLSSRAAAIQRLRSIGKNPVAVVSDVPHGGVVEVAPSSPPTFRELARQADGESGS